MESYPENSTACHMLAGGSKNTYEPSPSSGHTLDVRGVKSLRTSLDLELHLLTFCQRLESFHADSGEMHEHVLASHLLNEAIPLRIIEPLHFPSGHLQLPLTGEPNPAALALSTPVRARSI